MYSDSFVLTHLALIYKYRLQWVWCVQYLYLFQYFLISKILQYPRNAFSTFLFLHILFLYLFLIILRAFERSAMNRFFVATQKYSWNFEYQCVNNIEFELCTLIYSYLLQAILIYKYRQVAMSIMRTMLTSNSYQWKYVGFIRLLIYIHNFREILL